MARGKDLPLPGKLKCLGWRFLILIVSQTTTESKHIAPWKLCSSITAFLDKILQTFAGNRDGPPSHDPLLQPWALSFCTHVRNHQITTSVLALHYAPSVTNYHEATPRADSVDSQYCGVADETPCLPNAAFHVEILVLRMLSGKIIPEP